MDLSKPIRPGSVAALSSSLCNSCVVRYLLVIDTIGNVMLVDVVDDLRMPIGAPLSTEARSRVTTAAWSAQGQWTAWSVNSAEIDGIREVRLHDEDSDVARVLVQSAAAFYLCPSPCGGWLSHLSPGPFGLELAVSNVVTSAMHVIERGQPMFWSWSPNSSEIAVHVENRVLVADHDGRSTRALSDEAGYFIAPWWLPGGTVLFAIEDRIVAAGQDDSVTSLIAGGSMGRFSLAPEGRHLAYIDTAGENAALVALDLISLAPTPVTTAPTIAFFWSPDASRLAVLTTAGDGHVQWLVSEGSNIHHLQPFRPTRTWATSVLPFFEQYAQSHTVWSSDSTSLVVPAVDDQGQAGALIQTADSSGHQQWIPDAELAWWA